MSRCKCCNRKLFDTEMMSINEKSGLPEDTCNICKSIAYSEYNYFDEHEYVLGNLKEGLTPSMSSGE